MRLLTSREALIEKWALIGTTAIYRIITECLFACFQILQMLLIWGGGEGKIFLFGEEAFHFFRESFNFLRRELSSDFVQDEEKRTARRVTEIVHLFRKKGKD